MARPSLVTTGDHSTPLPVVTDVGRPPLTATRQICRRSMSSWLEENRISFRSALSETCSSSKSPGVSRAAWFDACSAPIAGEVFGIRAEIA